MCFVACTFNVCILDWSFTLRVIINVLEKQQLQIRIIDHPCDIENASLLYGMAAVSPSKI